MKFVLTCVFAILSYQGFAQTEIGFRATPNITSQPKVDNPSPAYIYGENTVSFDGVIDYTRMFKNKNYGLRIGTAMGLVDHRLVLEAPRNAFGNMAGDGKVSLNSSSNNYTYNSLGFQFIYRKTVRGMELEMYSGITKKFFHYSNDREMFSYAFNRSTPYDPDDPNAGPPDFSVDFAPIKNQLHVDIPLGIAVRRTLKSQNTITFGLVKNFNIEPIARGRMFVKMNNTSYNGEFNPRSSFIGVDLRYGYTLSKKPETTHREVAKTEGIKYQKAVFLEAFGNGYLASINYDTRLSKGHNDGFGLRLGIGKGHFFETDEPNNTSRYTTVPLNMNYILGAKRHGLELGLGITPSFTFHSVSGNSKNVTLGGFANINYRLQPLKEGLLFRLGFTPYFDKNEFEPTYISASIGYGFR